MSGSAASGPQELSERQLWWAADAFRGAAWVFAVGVFVAERDWYSRPLGALAVLLVLALWTVVLATLPVSSRGRTVWLVSDVALAVAAVLLSGVVQTSEGVDAGAHTVPAFWAAAPVMCWAVARGWRAGFLAGAAVGAADVIVIGTPNGGTIYAVVLLLLAGSVVGYAVQVLREGRRELARAAALEAARRERERLARDIHDSVLQVLAYISRRGAEVGGEAALLAGMAGEQEAKLRTLIARGGPSGAGLALPTDGSGRCDVAAAVAEWAGAGVLVSGPADPVLLEAEAASALLAAGAEALANVRRHAGEGAKAWVLLEDEPDRVVLSVRDDGAGIAPGRLEEAAGQGRLGVAASIRGRIVEVGGSVVIDSAPGTGTEVEVTVPRGPGRGSGTKERRG
ncbi:MAG: DUF5931 domain-containing protein [Kineosporiaceae bacterium]